MTTSLEAPPASLVVNEIFHSIQGEATHAGVPCVFVRLTACDLRCRWCDTEYAFHEGTSLPIPEIVARVAAFGCPLVEVTGGEPLLQRHTPMLVRALLDRGHEVLVETGGHLDIGGLDPRARVILDLKCPGSGEAAKNRWENLDRLEAKDAIKFVIADRGDYDWASETLRRLTLAGRAPVFFAPVHGELDPARLAGWILEDRLPVRLQLQIHKLLWGDRRGV
jgi:7-carboxy-7-deazaguanine synthase